MSMSGTLFECRPIIATLLADGQALAGHTEEALVREDAAGRTDLFRRMLGGDQSTARGERF